MRGTVKFFDEMKNYGFIDPPPRLVKETTLSTAPQYGRVCAEGGLETTSLTHFDTVGQEGNE